MLRYLKQRKSENHSPSPLYSDSTGNTGRETVTGLSSIVSYTFRRFFLTPLFRLEKKIWPGRLSIYSIYSNIYYISTLSLPIYRSPPERRGCDTFVETIIIDHRKLCPGGRTTISTGQNAPKMGEGWDIEDESDIYELIQTGKIGYPTEYDFETIDRFVNFILGDGRYSDSRGFSPGEEDRDEQLYEMAVLNNDEEDFWPELLEDEDDDYRVK